jgi:hypothetical protein
MAHNEIEGNVIGEIWRAQESGKEITYFLVHGEDNWFRIEYFGDTMLQRANWMAERLKAAAQGGASTEVGVDYDTLTVGEPPNLPLRTFNLVKYVQVRV